MKLFMADHLRRSGSLGKALQGAAGMLAGSDDDGSNVLTWRFLQATAISIAGGTNEVQRSIIGERVLGLPRDPKVGSPDHGRDVSSRRRAGRDRRAAATR
jgi:alkylation response protein AidB-like acyl-CoA dehydrogenase